MTPADYRRRARAVASLMALSIMVSSCTDRVTPVEPMASRGPALLSEQGVFDMSLYIPPNNTNSLGKVPKTSTGIVIPAYTSARITVRGRINVDVNPDHECCFDGANYPNAGRSTGPTGYGSHPDLGALRVRIYAPSELYYSSYNEAIDSVSWQLHLNSSGAEVQYARDGISGGSGCSSNPFPWQEPGCTCPDGPCLSYNAGRYSLSGDQSITVALLPNTLSLTADPSSGVPGTLVTFTPSFSDAPNYTVREWNWIPDDSTGTDPTTACPWSDKVCKRNIYRSGTMVVIASPSNATSKRFKAEAWVSMNPDSLELTASFTKIVIGEEVTFLAGTHLNRSFDVTDWSWTPSSPPDSTDTCSVPDSGCARPVFASGTMTVSALLDGQLQHASVTVEANPLRCPTGWPVLDDPNVRRLIIQEHALTNASDPIQTNRRERVLIVLSDLATGKLVPMTATDSSTSCLSYSSLPHPADYPGFRLVAHIHFHPAEPLTILACTEGGWWLTRLGGSELDWSALNTINSNALYQQAGWLPIEMFVFDELWTYRLRVQDIQGHEGEPQRRRDWRSATCDWNQF